jgi:hypothetical protein
MHVACQFGVNGIAKLFKARRSIGGLQANWP